MEEDFAEYSSTADMLSDPRGIYSVAEDVNPGRMSLDLSTGYGVSDRSMRYDYVGVGCTSQTIGRTVSKPRPSRRLPCFMIRPRTASFWM